MNTNRMNLNLLRIFAAIYEGGTLTRAAEQIGLSQPAVSHALKQLRETFEDELFVRDGGVYRPTRKAAELAPPILEALATLADTLETTHRFDPGTSTATFRLSVSDYSSQTILPKLSQLMLEQAPGIRLAISQISHRRLQEQLQLGEIDLAIVGRLPAALGKNQEPILEDEVVCLTRRDHPKVRRTLDLATFAANGHVIVNLTGVPSSAVDVKLAEIGKRRDVRLVVPYFNAVPEIVSTTDLIGTLPKRLAERAAETYALKIFPMPFEFPRVQFATCWHPRRERDVELRWLRKAIIEICGSL